MKRTLPLAIWFWLVALAAVAQSVGGPVLELRLGKRNSHLVQSAFVTTHSPDGKWMAVTTNDGVVNVIDASVPRVVRKFSAGGNFQQVEFLGNDKLAVGGKGGRITLWDARRGVILRTLREGGRDIAPMAASRDGTRIAFSAFNSSITVIDADSGSSLAEFDPGDEFKNSVMLLEFSPDGKRLASASFAGDLTLRDLEKKTVLWSSNVRTGKQALVSSGVMGPHYGSPDMLTEIEFSPDGGTIAADGPENQVVFIDAGSGKTLNSFAAMTGAGCAVHTLAFMPDGRSLFVGYASGIIRRLELAGGEEIFSVQGPGQIEGISVDPDGKRIRTLEREGYVIIRDAATGLTAREGMGRVLWSAAYSKDGKLLAAGSNDGTIDMFEMPGGKFLRRLGSPGGSVFGVDFSPDDRVLASADGETLRLWNPRTGEKLSELNPHDGFLKDFAFSSDGKFIFIAGYKSIGEWDVHLGTRVRDFAPAPEYIEDLDVSPDGRFVAAGTLYGHAFLWDRISGKEIFRKPDGVERWTVMREVAFTAGGRELVGLTNYWRDLVRLSIPDGKVLERRSTGQCVQGTISIPGGIVIVSKETCKDPRWTVKAIGREGKFKILHKDFFGDARVVEVSPDGLHWVTAAPDGVLSIWRAP